MLLFGQTNNTPLEGGFGQPSVQQNTTPIFGSSQPATTTSTGEGWSFGSTTTTTPSFFGEKSALTGSGGCGCCFGNTDLSTSMLFGSPATTAVSSSAPSAGGGGCFFGNTTVTCSTGCRGDNKVVGTTTTTTNTFDSSSTVVVPTVGIVFGTTPQPKTSLFESQSSTSPPFGTSSPRFIGTATPSAQPTCNFFGVPRSVPVSFGTTPSSGGGGSDVIW